MSQISIDAPGKELLIMGNEAIARGALEAGVHVCAAYPGTPSSEIIGSLSQVADEMGIYVEWSTNEKVALEVAASAAYSGLKSICAMKQNGLNVASDFLFNLNMIGIEGALLLVTCDDPGCHSSTNEQDTRFVAQYADLPLLEPGTFQEAKDMAKWAFTISEEIKNVCMLRGVTRISHARGNVRISDLPKNATNGAYFDRAKQRITFPVPQKHERLHETLEKVEEVFENSEFNRYIGPKRPDVLIITSGSPWLYSQEALMMMGLESSVGILKVGTTWPLPKKLVLEHLATTDKILLVEEVDPFLERNVKEIAADYSMQIGPKAFFGKSSKHIPYSGEMNADRVVAGLSKILDLPFESRDEGYEGKAQSASKITPVRSLGFCPGCPHRASYWSIKNAFALDDREGFVTGDIGCYHLARTAAGWNLLSTSGGMGTGSGLASGFGKLEKFGFTQPVIAVCGDSTFFHAAMPALVNAHFCRSNMIVAVLDNSATAMTGFQPNPAVGENAMGDTVTPVDIEKVCRSFGAKVAVTDPFDLDGTQKKLMEMLEDLEGIKVIIMRRKCALIEKKEAKEKRAPYQMSVDHEKCLGDHCGCNRFCTRFKCPGLIWDRRLEKARVDEAVCVGCGVCADICPQNAITRKEIA